MWVTRGASTARTCSSSISDPSSSANSRSPSPRRTGANEISISSSRPARRYCRITLAPPVSHTSFPPAASVASFKPASMPSVTKWKVVPPCISSDSRGWWVSTKTGTWYGGFSPHQPRQSPRHGPGPPPNMFLPMTMAPTFSHQPRTTAVLALASPPLPSSPYISRKTASGTIHSWRRSPPTPRGSFTLCRGRPRISPETSTWSILPAYPARGHSLGSRLGCLAETLFWRSPLAALVARVRGPKRLDQQKLAHLGGLRTMLHALGHDQKVPGTQFHVPFSHLHGQPTRYHEKELVGVVMLVPNPVSLDLDELHLVVVQVSDDLRSPEIVELAQAFFEIHLRHAFLLNPSGDLRWPLFLNGSAYGSQMIAERQGRGLLALRKVDDELHLAAQGDTCTHPFGLASLGVADPLRKREEVVSAGSRHEEHPIVVAQDQVLPTHRPLSHGGDLQRIMGTGIKALGPGWDRSQAEDRQPNRSYVSRVPMEPPDHESLQPSSLSLQSHQIADARFVESSAIVDDQHVARGGSFQRFKEDIDAAKMLSRKHTPSKATARYDSLQERRRTAHRDLSAKACIRDMGSRQRREPPPNLFRIHRGAHVESSFPSLPPLSTSSRRPSLGGEKTSRVIHPSSLVTAPWGTLGSRDPSRTVPICSSRCWWMGATARGSK